MKKNIDLSQQAIRPRHSMPRPKSVPPHAPSRTGHFDKGHPVRTHRYPLPPKPERSRNKENAVFFTMLVALMVLGILFPIWPKEEISQSEKRALEQFPEFTPGSLLSGEFSQRFESFFADQFPFREELISVNRGVKSLLQAFPGSGKGEMKLITAKKDTGGKGEMLILETTEPSASHIALPAAASPDESKTSAEPPKETKQIMESEVAGGDQGELDYETTNLIIKDGRAMEIFNYAEELMEDYANRVNHLRSVLDSDKRLFSMVVPTAVAYYGTDELRTGAKSTYDAIKSIYDKESPEIIRVDAYSKLGEHRDEYIYFRTDHHWNGRGAYYGYVAFCEAAGLTPTPLKDMEMTQPEGTFMGSLYGYTDESPLLENSADRAEFFHPKHKGSNYFYSDASMSDPLGNILLAADVQQDNQYLLYMGGDAPLNILESELENGKYILVIKDSYANAFMPYLMDHYERVYAIDPRSFTDPLIPFIEEQGIEDVLIMNYSFAVSNWDWLAGFDQITGLSTEP